MSNIWGSVQYKGLFLCPFLGGDSMMMYTSYDVVTLAVNSGIRIRLQLLLLWTFMCSISFYN